MPLARFAAAVVLATAGLAIAQVPATQPTTRPSVDDILRKIRAEGAWLDRVKSVDIQWEGRWSKSAESIRIRRAAILREHPTIEPSPEELDELRAEVPTTARLAFDERRMLYAYESAGQTRTRSTWDGTRAVAWTQWPATKDGNATIDLRVGKTFAEAAHELQWNWDRRTPHAFWWLPPAEPTAAVAAEDADDPADRLVITGRATFRGTDCWRMEHVGFSSLRLYVGVADWRPRGETSAASVEDDDPRAIAAAVKTAAEGGGRATDVASFQAWLDTLPKADRTAAFKAYRFARDTALPDAGDARWFDEWREITPGGWLPMREGYTVEDVDPETKKPYEAVARERRVTAVRVNGPLDDALFAQSVPDGVEVFDKTHDPPLTYKQKANRTPAEWDELVAQANARGQAEKQRVAAMDKWKGKSPIPFGDRRWLNLPNGTPPPTWASLKGKVVLLDFSAEWCGPCANDWPTLADIYRDADKSGVTVVGIHPPGSSDAKMQKMIDGYHLAYPICIDTPAIAEDGMGELFARYGVSAIPWVFVIDADGKVAGHGSLGEMLPLARSLARREK